jgi:hypothetical protein
MVAAENILAKSTLCLGQEAQRNLDIYAAVVYWLVTGASILVWLGRRYEQL